MSTSSIREIWKLLENHEVETSVLKNKDMLLLLLFVDKYPGIPEDLLLKRLNNIKDIKHNLVYLIEKNFISNLKNKINLLKKGQTIISYIRNSIIDISNIKDNVDGFKIEQPPIGKGSTSVTYKATKTRNNKTVVLKIFKPGILNDVNFEDQIKDIINISANSSHIVIPYEWGNFNYNGIKLNYIEMDFIQGKSLQEFLTQRANIDIQETLKNFILEVGSTLRSLHQLGYKHGDLHLKNILVVNDEIEEYKKKGIFHFKIIDFIGINVLQEFNEYQKSDFEFFKEDLLHFIRVYCLTNVGNISEKILGERLTFIYKNLINDNYKSINDVINGLYDKLPNRDQIEIGKPFSYLIFETLDIKESNWINGFAPDPMIYKHFIDFEPLVCSGPRGGGKTIYLRSLSFIPSLIKASQVDPTIRNKIPYYSNIFGIYFPCRQGEFKYFSDKQYNFKIFNTQLFLKHILILRIIRRTISLINEGYENDIFTSIPKIEEILNFILYYLIKHEVSFSTSAKDKPFKELATILKNEENLCIDLLGDVEQYPKKSHYLNEAVLIDFFKTCRNSISELSTMKFYIIFDDVSEPQVNIEVQKILNCLMACHNEVYCCKFSTDKFAYTFEDMFGKALQVPHDYSYIDMSYVENFEEYLEKIINRQLEISEYKKGIKYYLENLPYNHQKLINFLSKKDKKKIKYAGWNLIVHLSSDGVRDALAICDYIFQEYGDYKNHGLLRKGDHTISIDIQNKAIRKYSEEVYASLINIESVGKQIFDITRNFGEISRRFLERSITNDKERKYEMITIERRDANKLAFSAEDLLGKLIRHSVFLDKGFSHSREQMGLVQKFTLHKKYTPALRTTFREREHLRLSSSKLEMFLLYPDKFREEIINKNTSTSTLSLFDDQ